LTSSLKRTRLRSQAVLNSLARFDWTEIPPWPMIVTLRLPGRPAPSQAMHVSHVRTLPFSVDAGHSISPLATSSCGPRTRNVRQP